MALYLQPAVHPKWTSLAGIDLASLSSSELRATDEGWYAIVSLSGNKHRLYLRERPDGLRRYEVVLPVDDDFELRAAAAVSFWRGLRGQSFRGIALPLSHQRHERVALMLRAFDGRIDGGTYRQIAEVLFGARRIPERAWKTHDLRNRTIRLVRGGIALVRRGYRQLLRPGGRRR
jgi:type VI secretion system activator RovC-like protein